MRILDLTGKKFGRLRVVARGPDKEQGRPSWLCVCTCGKQSAVDGRALRCGNTRSCGCWKDEKTGARRRTHGMSYTVTYAVWRNMHERCGNPNNTQYADYGGRGIGVCTRWHSFENFLADMGERPEGMTLERMKNSRGYSKSNCVWATRMQQAKNKRNNRWLTAGGETLHLAEWGRRLGISASSVAGRVCRGWTVEAACTTPKQRTGKESK